MGDRVSRSTQSMTSKLKQAVGARRSSEEAASQTPVTLRTEVGHDPELSTFILTQALKRPEGVSFTDLVRALLDAKDRAGDKTFRTQLPSLLLRLTFYEYLPADVIARLVPLFKAYAKDTRVVRSLFYLIGANVTRGSSGTPTLIDPALPARGPDQAILQLVIAEGQRLLQAPDADAAVRRAAAYLLAAAGRSAEPAQREALAALERAVNAADALAAASPAKSGSKKKLNVKQSTPAVSSRHDWDLQHTVFGAARFSGAPAMATDLAAACFLGVGSPDPVGARHALSMAAEVALRDPSAVVGELSRAVRHAADVYETSGPTNGLAAGAAGATSPSPAASSTPPPSPGSIGEGINLEDAFARLALARTCAHVLHSDQGSGDASRGGAPFWRMLCLLAARDPSDMVRFGALHAMTGTIVGGSDAGRLGGGGGVAGRKTSSSSSAMAMAPREDTAQRHRRARAWRLLASRAGEEVFVPGIEGPVKLIDVVARFILLALRKTENAARFCAAADVASSLAESCLASQSVGGPRHVASPDAERALGILSRELGSLIESPLRPAQRCGCIEALLYLQAAGFSTLLTPAKVAQVGGQKGGGGGSGGGLQDALLAAVLKCAKARPKDAASFLSYASGVVGISPGDVDMNKVVELWDAAANAGQEGKHAALAVALDALSGPPPPAATTRVGASRDEVTRAARADAGWSRFLATAAWWIGEKANVLCGEFVGRNVTPIHVSEDDDDDDAAAAAAAAMKSIATPRSGVDVQNGSSSEDGKDDFHDGGVSEGDEFSNNASPATSGGVFDGADSSVMEKYAGRNPILSRVIDALQTSLFTAAWQLRVASARALATIALRSGEPFRLHCYGILAAASMSGGRNEDALGLRGVTAPALSLLDAVYATQATLEALWAQHGDDIEGWPPEIAASLARRDGELRSRAERFVCAVPKERYGVLGARAMHVLATAVAEDGSSYASFLSSVVGGGDAGSVGGSSARGGKDLASTKNREVEDILSFGGGGSEEASTSFSFYGKNTTAGAGSGLQADAGGLGRRALTPRSPGAMDRDQQVERMLFGGGALGASPSATTDPWKTYVNANTSGASMAAATGGEESFNAFAEAVPSPRAGSSIDGAAALTQQHQHQQQQQHAESGTAQVMGSGTMLHTFIADPNHPEELSIFEGDTVQVLEDTDDWLLVRDPSGNQGLVPSSYVHLERLFGSGGAGGGGSGAAGGGGVWGTGALSTQGSGFNTAPVSSSGNYQHAASTLSHVRSGSFETGSIAGGGGGGGSNGVSNNEAVLEHLFAGGGGTGGPPESVSPSGAGHTTHTLGTMMPGMPEGESWGAVAATSPTASLRRLVSGSSPRKGSPSPTRFSPSWVATNEPALSGGGATSTTASHVNNPFGSGALATPGAGSPSGVDGGYGGGGVVGTPGSVVSGAGGGGGAANAAGFHRRVASTVSSHQRTLSGSSDVYASMPGSPSLIAGQERGIVAGFAAEMEGELSVGVGDRVKVHSESGGWARVLRISDKKSGLVPSWAVGAGE